MPGGNASTEVFGPTSAAGNSAGGNNTVRLPDISGDPSDQSTELPIGLGAGVLFAVCSFGACYAVRKRRQRRQAAHTFEKPDELCVGNPTFEINNPAFDSSSSSTKKSSGAAHSDGATDTDVSLAAEQGAVAVTAGADEHVEHEFVQVRQPSVSNNQTHQVQDFITVGSGMQTTYTDAGSGDGGANFTRDASILQDHVIVSDGTKELLVPLDTSTVTRATNNTPSTNGFSTSANSTAYAVVTATEIASAVSTVSLSSNHPAARQLLKMEEDAYTLEAKNDLRTSTHGPFLILSISLGRVGWRAKKD